MIDRMDGSLEIREREMSLVRADERVDDLQRNGYRIIQKKSGFRFGMDAVLLSGFARVRRGEKVADLGTGTGIIPILLEAKTEGDRFFGLELQEEVADMAARSVSLNGICGRLSILRGDVRALLEKGPEAVFDRISYENGERALSKESLVFGSFDVITSNPPYMDAGGGLMNPNGLKNISRHEIYLKLDEVCAAAGRLLKSGGRFYMVHRPMRLAEIISDLKKYKLEPKRMKFVHPFSDRDANMVLIESVKSGGSQVTVEKPIIVYEKPGRYSSEIYDIYGY